MRISLDYQPIEVNTDVTTESYVAETECNCKDKANRIRNFVVLVNRHVQSICNCVKLRASVVVNIMEFTAHSLACMPNLFDQDGKLEMNLE